MPTASGNDSNAGSSAAPIAISQASHSSTAPLPEPLRALVNLRIKADSALNHPALEQELENGVLGPQSAIVLESLQATLECAATWRARLQDTTGRTSKRSNEEEARGEFVEAWCRSRIGESLQGFSRAGELLGLPDPPTLDQVPSVTRPKQGVLPLELGTVPGWVGEMLAEWARTQTTLCFSSLLRPGGNEVVEEDKLAEMLDMACRRNVQALFTPVDPNFAPEESSSSARTVMGNARLIRDMSTLLPFTSSASLWNRRIAWATHVADITFIEASMSANRLVDAASAAAAILQDPKTTNERRNEVRHVLEHTIQHLVPFEKKQGTALLTLGRVMLEAVGSMYLDRDEAFSVQRRKMEDAVLQEGKEPELAEGERVEVPENDLVRETRQVFIRGEFHPRPESGSREPPVLILLILAFLASGLFENAYASFLRTPTKARQNKKEEQRLLRRLEATYCDLEELDNHTPEVVQLKSERVARALWINDRLLSLGDDADDDSDLDDADEDSDGEMITRRFGQSTI
ncbi:BZ3500_MvSof-1268-A1-R1_Chr2-1g04277 [Microbotryum saponariae]|uniref:BZ3500_MvSof-1268-A1-R1_Chr2-1g04277 protein n=1 Tax=Microbotryum saponariae TaxID=289078 RepID=A0A2X0MAV9_9BASI|nr:BZ3500_MvSof-1268-A1-R1_Chr2-1g04277 [Microbotryum saponariae]SCZ91297.1 BZ3501_MvSof-1269-A2-R1_Chr2-1g03933 [Microbotryum saponariae]